MNSSRTTRFCRLCRLCWSCDESDTASTGCFFRNRKFSFSPRIFKRCAYSVGPAHGSWQSAWLIYICRYPSQNRWNEAKKCVIEAGIFCVTNAASRLAKLPGMCTIDKQRHIEIANDNARLVDPWPIIAVLFQCAKNYCVFSFYCVFSLASMALLTTKVYLM